MMNRQKIKVDDGNITIGYEQLGSMFRKLEDGTYAVTVSDWKDDRSLRQNRYYWKCITIIGNDLGYHKNEMHETFLDAFSPIKTIRNLQGKPIQKPVRTSEMSVEQMTAYIEQIIQFASEQNIKLPNPEDHDHNN